jgi:hypothetical protein
MVQNYKRKTQEFQGSNNELFGHALEIGKVFGVIGETVAAGGITSHREGVILGLFWELEWEVLQPLPEVRSSSCLTFVIFVSRIQM